MLAAARSLFGKQGYAHTSVDQIAAAARVTKGAVYHHFSGKQALFRAVHAEVEAEALARVVQTPDPGTPPIDELVAEMNRYLDAALDEEIRRITLVDGPAVLGLQLDPPEYEPAHEGLRAFLAEAMAGGEIVELDADVLARLLGGLALQGGLLIARSGDPEATRAALGEALEAVLRGLSPGQR